MTPEIYQQRWQAWQQRRNPDQLRHLTRQIALSFVDRCLYNDRYEAAYIDLLCEMATSDLGDELDRIAAGALFGIVIESLCDDFEEFQTSTYNRVMCQVIGYCCRLPQNQQLAAELETFGLAEPTQLRERIEELRTKVPSSPDLDPERILFLSRVTIGADVALTSVLIKRLRRRFPEAELVLLGSDKLAELFGGLDGLRVRTLRYARRGGLLKRFETWHHVLDAVRSERRGVQQLLVVDPDSRLSQLGILPVADEDAYWFFNSRRAIGSDSRQSISELANDWLNAVLEEETACMPGVWLPTAVRKRGAQLVGQLRGQGAEHIITINLGVGGNPRKRLSRDFEKRLLRHLLETPKTVVLLDNGFGESEQARAAWLRQQLAADGVKTIAGDLNCELAPLQDHGIVGLNCSIGEIAGLIQAADEFIGYDSACQHIAAAVGVPGCTVFAGTNNPRFVRRWQACGPARTEVVHVDTLSFPQRFDEEDIITRIIHVRNKS